MIILSLLLAAADPTPKAAPPAKELKTPAKGTISVATASNAGKTWDISVGDCKKPKDAPVGECSIFVSLKKGGSGKHKLEWTSKTGGIYVQGERSVAIGDEADTAMALSWRPVTVAKGVDGIIVTQQSGEPRKHRHDLLVAYRGKLNHAFTARDGRGPMTWSSVTPLDVDGDKNEELILMNASRPDEEMADNWEISVWAWRADAAKIVKMPSWTPTIHAAMVGVYANVKEAREQQAEKCLREFIVIDSKSAPLMQENMFAVAYPSATQRDADLALEAAKACDDSIVGAVKAVTRGMDVKE
jgi:hypothetical protein